MLVARPVDEAVAPDWAHAHFPLLQAAYAGSLIFLLLVPVAASAGIYKWIDETGTTVYSNNPPAKATKAKNVEVVIEDEQVPTRTAQQVGQADALRREQQLAERIYYLERQLQAQQQYQTPVPPPPADYNYPNSYYPGYYPIGYGYPYVVLPSRFIRPAHTFISPRFTSARFATFHHGGSVRRGRR